MFSYFDGHNHGIVHENKELIDLLAFARKTISSLSKDELVIPIPSSANDLTRFLEIENNVIGKYEKSTFYSDINEIITKNKIVLFDDVICHGETIWNILTNIHSWKNIKMFIFLYYIPSMDVCLYDPEQKRFTIEADNKICYLYFIKKRLLLKIPTLVVQTQKYVLLKSDIMRYGRNYTYEKKGHKLDFMQVIKNL